MLCITTALAANRITYNDHVVPVLRNHCFNCHNSDKKKGDLDLSTFNGVLAGGGSGEVIVPGDVGASRLWKLLNHLEEPFMPPKSPKIPDADLAVVKGWIEGGMLESSGSKAIASKKPKVDLTLKTTSTGKPDGPPPMPTEDLLLEPVVHAKRSGAITAIAASPWAPLLAVAGQHQVILYHFETLAIAGVLPFPEGFPYVVKFSHSGQLILVGGGVGAKIGKVVLFDVTTGRRITEVGDEYDAVLAADLSPDQAHIALGGPSKLVRIYSTATGELLHTIKKHTDWITAISYSPDGVLLVSGDRNGGVHVWEASTARPYSDLKAHQQRISDISWRDDANVVATASEDGQIMLWEVENSSRIRNWAAHGGGVEAVRFSHDGRLVSTGRDRTTKLWDANGGQQRAFEAFTDIALVAAISSDMTRVAAGDFSGEVRVWNAADGRLLGKMDANPPSLADRLAGDEKRLRDANADHAKLVAANQAAQDAIKKAQATFDQARDNASKMAAAAVASETALNTATQAHAQAVAAREKEKQKEADAPTPAVAPVPSAPSTNAPAVEPKVEKAPQASTAPNFEEMLKAAREAHAAAVAAAKDAAAAVAPAETQLKSAKDAAAQAQAQVETSTQLIASITQDLRRWKIAQFNVQVLRAKDELDKQQAVVTDVTSQTEAAENAAKKGSEDLAALRQALSEAPGLIAARTDELGKTQTQLTNANAVVPVLRSNLVLKQNVVAEKTVVLQSASQAATNAQNLLLTIQETAANAEVSSKSAALTVAKAKATAAAMTNNTQLGEAAAKAQQAAAEAAAAYEILGKAVIQFDAQVKDLVAVRISAAAHLAAAQGEVTAMQQSITNQLSVIAQAEAAVKSATDALAQAKKTAEELPAKIAALEPMVVQAASAATKAREFSGQAIAQLQPLRQKHEELLGEYQKLKTAAP